jgi:hypothetical protein
MDGVDLKTPFGVHHVPGLMAMKPAVLASEEAMSKYTISFVVLLTTVYVVWKFTGERAQTISAIKQMMKGEIPDDPDVTPEEKQMEIDDKMDPKSEDFIAPGNIYRVLAVLHPGKLGYVTWSKTAFKALVSAYMQIYIPYRIMRKTTEDWHCLGVKSPLWFLENAGSFTSMMAALMSLCNMFAGKCARNIQTGAEANLYILSRKEPGEASYMSLAAGSPEAQEAATQATQALMTGGSPDLAQLAAAVQWGHPYCCHQVM